MTTLILVRPQLGENIGMVARAMLNCGFEKLSLVDPRDGWPNPAAFPAAAGADHVLKNAAVFNTVDESIAACQHVVATTARKRDMEKPVQFLPDWAETRPATEHTAILFGAEASGLSNEELNLADTLITIPTNPTFPSLNLAQSVYAVCSQIMDRPKAPAPLEHLAPKKELTFFLEALESDLDLTGFFHPAHKKPLMRQNIRNIFSKARLTSQEIQTLHGILKALKK